MTERILRIFVSSPSDVAPERARVKLVADRLNGELEGIVRLDTLRWEDGFYSAATSFQQAIDQAIGNMTATDMVLCILWKRAGLMLNPAIWRRADGSSYESGTVLEFETAIAVSREHSGVPDCYLFRKSADVLYRADRASEEMEQHQLLEAVWQRWTQSAEGYNTAGYQHFSDTDDFETKLDACLRQWLERLGVVAKGPVWDRARKGSPFRGLAAFEAAHSSVFFGRETAIARATERLRRAPFLLVIGASGSGKSSLLRAGLIPRVTAPGVIPDIDLWRTAVIVPSGDPIAALADALYAGSALGAELRAGDFSDPHLLAELLSNGGNAALAPIRTAIARAAAARKEALHYDEPRPARLFIAVDQVERLFVEVEPERVEAFARLLRALVEGSLASLTVVLRSDTYGRFQTVASFLALLESKGATLDLLPPSPSELEDIVTRPIAACHPPLAYELDARGRSLAEVLVADAKGGDALPLLQMTLQRLFDAEGKRGDGLLRFADYPGMDAAVTRTAEEAVARLDERALAALPALLTAFVRDVTITPDGALESLTIVPVTRADFERGEAARTALIDEFIAQRLVTAEDVGGNVQVRPVHEALLRVVPAAVAVIKENAALIRVRHTLEPMVAEWSRAGAAAKADFLATSPALIAGAAQLDERFGADLPAGMREFIAQSLAADLRRREAERSRHRRILTATAAGLVLALGLAGLAGWQWRSATEQRQIAETQRLRAQNALAAATRTADTLIFDLAQELRRRTGMPVDLTRLILQRVQDLQRQLAESGETTPDLRRLEVIGLSEIAKTFLAQGDTAASLASLERGRTILNELIKADSSSLEFRRLLSVITVAIGDARFALNGKWDEALDTYGEALEIIEKLAGAFPNEQLFQIDLSYCLGKGADMLMTGGKREDALRLYRKALEIIQKLARDKPDDQQLLDPMASLHNRMALVLQTLGQSAAALEDFRASVDLRERLTAADPGNTAWQSDYFLSLSNMGEVLATMGRRQDALANFRRALAVIEMLVTSDAGNLQWQRSNSVVLDQIGDILLAGGETGPALASYQKSLAIRQKLVAAVPGNTTWQRDLAVSLNKFGDALKAANRLAEAVTAYEAALAAALKLAAINPQNTDWQRDVTVCYLRIGDAVVKTDVARARELYEQSLVIREKLLALDPELLPRQRDVTVVYDRLGNLLYGDMQYQAALDIYRKGLAMREKIAAVDAGNVQAQRDLLLSHNNIGGALLALGRAEEARKAYRDALAIAERYAAANSGEVQFQFDLVLSLYQLADVGDEPRPRLERGLAMLRQLDAAGRLNAGQKSWILLFEQALAALPK